MAISNQEMIAVQTGHQVDLIRVGNGAGSKVDPHLIAISKYTREVLLQYDVINTIKLRDQIVKDISKKMEAELGEFVGGFSSDMNKIISEEVLFQYALINEATKNQVSVTKPTIKDTKRLINQKPLVLNNRAVAVADYIGDYTPKQIAATTDVIVAGWANGQTTREIAQAITGTKQVKGILQASQQSAYKMGRDVTSHISSHGKAQLGKDNDDIIIGEKVIVTLDSRTSPICQDYGSQDGGGKEFIYAEDGHNFPRPPFHINCRSSMIPLMSDEFREITDEDAKRPAVVDGKAILVDADTDWMELAKQYPSLAEQSLGKTKAAILDNMTAKEFTDTAYNRLGQPMTIEQMAANNAKAAQALNDSK